MLSHRNEELVYSVEQLKCTLLLQALLSLSKKVIIVNQGLVDANTCLLQILDTNGSLHS
jgi:hypothetical protein